MGAFDRLAAESLLELFNREYPAGGRVFVDTRNLYEIHESGRCFLAEGVKTTPVAMTSLFFMGEQGFRLAPNGSRVITFKQKDSAKLSPDHEGHTCCGKCSHCHCQHKHESAEYSV
jgi:hypothetical protein